MLTVRIQRTATSAQGTIGTVTLIDGGQPYTSLEPPPPGNGVGASHIPAGRYHAYAEDTEHWQTQAYRLRSNTIRSVDKGAILILPGVWAGDTKLGFYFDMLGSIAFGVGTAMLQPPEQNFAQQLGLMHSRAAFYHFMRRVMGYRITIEIADP